MPVGDLVSAESLPHTDYIQAWVHVYQSALDEGGWPTEVTRLYTLIGRIACTTQQLLYRADAERIALFYTLLALPMPAALVQLLAPLYP